MSEHKINTDLYKEKFEAIKNDGERISEYAEKFKDIEPIEEPFKKEIIAIVIAIVVILILSVIGISWWGTH